MATENIAKIYAGVVKAPSSVHLKNPSLYIDVLEGKEVLYSAFFKPETGCHKATDAIRVDGVNCEQRKVEREHEFDCRCIHRGFP